MASPAEAMEIIRRGADEILIEEALAKSLSVERRYGSRPDSIQQRRTFI